MPKAATTDDKEFQAYLADERATAERMKGYSQRFRPSAASTAAMKPAELIRCGFYFAVGFFCFSLLVGLLALAVEIVIMLIPK